MKRSVCVSLLFMLIVWVSSRQTPLKRQVLNRHSTAKKQVRYQVLFGGAFNPFGLHHLEIVKNLLRQPDVDSVIINPDSDDSTEVPSFIKHKTNIDWKQRAEMCLMTLEYAQIPSDRVWVTSEGSHLVDNIKRFASSIEARNSDASEKYRFRLGLVMGADHLPQIEQILDFNFRARKDGERIEGTLFINPRTGYPLAGLPQHTDYRVLPRTSPRFDGSSSTKIRNLLQDEKLSREEKHRRAEQYLAPRVVDFIIENNLYA